MGYRSEVSVIVGKNMVKRIDKLVKSLEAKVAKKKIKDYDLEHLKDFLATKTVNEESGLTRYYMDYIKWYTHCDPDEQCLTAFEDLIVDWAQRYENLKDGDECSFIRLGESNDDRDDYDNWGGLQELTIKPMVKFKKP